ncbi:MAG: peptide chain release factor N(5)-glutamine methyltransferase [Candidatus Omnitrophota bacterium]|nr:peptide chain release factor N(5)-glutamine methyltransferase [Candidatus Omnitrophota bacterium]
MNEAELLFSQVLGCDRLALSLNKDRYLGREELDFITCSLKRRIKGEPIQYILGKMEFMGLELKIKQDVLIPRPETEILVQTALKYIKQEKSRKILDLGTGSGCIAISLGKNSANLEIDASDISSSALAVAKENAGLNGVKIDFVLSDLFRGLRNKKYDLITSNPPYVREGEITKLQPELQFEPKLALNGGPDGLDFYRRIISGSANYLQKNGLLIMEMGFEQKPDIETIFLDLGKFKLIEVIKDYNNIDRVIVARKADING